MAKSVCSGFGWVQMRILEMNLPINPKVSVGDFLFYVCMFVYVQKYPLCLVVVLGEGAGCPLAGGRGSSTHRFSD